jgi:predicted nuclease of restriction endonuclease-like (RecB) superfamily
MHLKLAIIVLFIAESLYSVDFNEYLEKYLVDKQKLDHIKVDFFIIQNLSIEDKDLEEKSEDHLLKKL